MKRRVSSYVNPAYAHDEGVTPEFRRPSDCSRTKSKNLTFREKIMQQKMDAWKPVYEPYLMLVSLFIISIIFIILGILMYREINRVLSIENSLTCNITENLNNKSNITMNECNFNITEDITGDIIFMYRISNFYQNHRLYESTVYHNTLYYAKDVSYQFITFNFYTEVGMRSTAVLD